MRQRVVVFADVVRNELSLGAREALALGRRIADHLGYESVALLLNGDQRLGADAICRGADTASLLTKPLPPDYQPEMYAEIGGEAWGKLDPAIGIVPHSPAGCDLAPRLSFQLQIPWAAGCLDVRVSGQGVSVTRNYVGGKVLLEEDFPFPILATIRSRIVEPLPRDETREGTIHYLDLVPRSDGRLTHLEHQSTKAGVADELAEATVVVSGGLGMGSESGFAALEELAAALDARVGASKAAVDRGWVTPERQVGLTGVTVAPSLYIAVGISGSAQHMAGCSKSKALVAINKDPQANIFNFAKYGLVAEWEQALPILLASLKEEKTRGRR